MEGEDLQNSVARQAKARTRKHRHYFKMSVRLAAFLANLKRAWAAPKNWVCRPMVKRLLTYHRQFAEGLRRTESGPALRDGPRTTRAGGFCTGSWPYAPSRQFLLARFLRISGACKRATSKATMCLEINRYANYVPMPKKIRSTYNQGLSEPKITGPGWEHANHHVWNQQDESIPAEPRGSIFRPAMGLRAKPRCVLKSTDTKITVPFPRRCGLNSHKHLQQGGRTERLPEKLLRAGDREGEVLYRWFRAEITATFGTGRPQDERGADPAARCYAEARCAYNQSRNVVLFQGDRARDSTFD
jgi:hypothetical protein